jgi:RNA 3'-terminal phosphate cyclase (ATP)
MITIDGSFGEGGGQIVRSSLSLSMLTRTPFRIHSIRAGRRKPGLMRQHLAAVRAAAAVCGATVTGDSPGSRELQFSPGQITGGSFRFDTETAGSTSLVLQTILPALLSATEASRVEIHGGTHNPLAPTTDYLNTVFLPVLRTMGASATLTLVRHGFYPAGGGTVVADITPCSRLKPLALTERGALKAVRVEPCTANLEETIGEREIASAREVLDEYDITSTNEIVESDGPGNVVRITVEHEHCTEQFTGFGAKGVPAEEVATKCAREARRYLKGTAPVSTHLADQLLIPLYLSGGTTFHCTEPSEHTRTNAQVIGLFTDCQFQLRKMGQREWEVGIADRGLRNAD